MWRIYKGFKYKEMKYENSCFPCAVHTILANLNEIGYKGTQETLVEDAWNTLHGDLNKSAPNEQQIHRYLFETGVLGKHASLYTPTSFQNKEVTMAICDKIKHYFIQTKDVFGMVVGVGHAHVFYKKKDQQVIHFHPSTQYESIPCEQVKIIDVRVLEEKSKDKQGYAVGIVYMVDSEVCIQPAEFICMMQ